MLRFNPYHTGGGLIRPSPTFSNKYILLNKFYLINFNFILTDMTFISIVSSISHIIFINKFQSAGELSFKTYKWYEKIVSVFFALGGY